MTPARIDDVDAVIARLRERLDPVGGPFRAARRGDHDPDRDLDRDWRGLGDEPARVPAPAAVLAPLVVREGALWFVFTERAAHLKRHAGQISFPGGRKDAEDRDLAAAALRESREEIGLDPARVELLGAFDAYETITGYAITPFVGLVRGEFAPAPDPREVAGVFEAPFAYVMDPANLRRGSREWRGRRRWFYEIPYGERRIWGATAGLLKSLHDRLYADTA